MTYEKLGSLLLKKMEITPGELSLALAVQGALPEKERLGGILSQYDFLSEEALAQALAEQCGWTVFKGELVADTEAVGCLGVAFAREHGVVPVRTPDGLRFVLSDPFDIRATDHVMAVFGPGVRFQAGQPRVIAAALRLLENTPAAAAELAPEEGGRDDARLLLDEAVARDATDIHIEPSAKAVEVRLRIDGVLRFHRCFPLKDHARLVNIFFNRAQISAGDFLRFHDARFDHDCGRKKVDVRLSHIPGINGSSLVLRLQDKTRAALSLESLGYARAHELVIERALQRPHGITLLTGPTGCGKTTSLYAMLGRLKDIGAKIVAVEDPVEIRLPLVTQVPVDIRKGHDFHQVTRAMLRHDPDIILVGEIRDEKTASEAVRAAITGHRVFSTLHTSDAVSAILRLSDLGVGHSYIANTLACVISQRLVRKLCLFCRREECVTPASVPEEERAYLSGPGQIVYRADIQGCSRCLEGFSGRTVVAQALLIDDEIRFMIEQGLVHEIFLKVREKRDVLSMRRDAARLVEAGVTSLDEAVRVVGG